MEVFQAGSASRQTLVTVASRVTALSVRLIRDPNARSAIGATVSDKTRFGCGS